MSWHLGPLLGFDTETTGVDVENDRIVTAALVAIQPGERTNSTTHLIAVDVDIPAAATEVHGLTTEYAREHGKPAATVLDSVAARLAWAAVSGVPIVGCNLAYDFTLLDRELRRNSLPTLVDRIGGPIAPVVDVFVLDKAVDPYRKGGRKLTDLAAAYGVRVDDLDAHDAGSDALMAARVAYRLMQIAHSPAHAVEVRYADRRRPAELVAAFTNLGQMSLAQLHTAQVQWRAEQMDGLRRYFDRQGTEHDGCDGSWPMRPYAMQQEVTV